LLDEAIALRVSHDRPVVCGEVVEASACEAAIRLAEQVLDEAQALAGDDAASGSARVASGVKQFTTRDIRYLLAQVRQEIAKALRREKKRAGTPPEGRPTEQEPALASRNADDPPYVFRREGGRWRVRFGAESGDFEDTAGMGYLARLLARPDRWLSALELVQQRCKCPKKSRSVLTSEEAGGEEAKGEEAEANVPLGTQRAQPQPVLDYEALQACKRRLKEIDEEIDDAKERGLAEGPVEQLHRERLDILNELKKVTKPGGSPRCFVTTPEEKARQTVKKALGRAYGMLKGQGMDQLADHLKRAVSTGKHCAYHPGANFPEWAL
jgi:non-specific serine/threonine protein kinase